MPNSIKYNTSAETLALKSGNFWIGTGDVGKGPTNITGYYNGITPPSGGYTIYLNKSSGGPSIYVATNDSQLISLTNRIAGASYTTVAQCLEYYVGQSDKICTNIDYGPIITDGLVLNVDAGFTLSYPTTGTTWYDVSSSGNNGTLTNGPTFNSNNGGYIQFDGSNDFVTLGNQTSLGFTSGVFSVESWIYIPSTWTAGSQYPNLISKGATAGWDTDGWSLFVFRDYPSAGQYSWGCGVRNNTLSPVNNIVSRVNCGSNTWLNVMITLNGSSIILYENGIQQTSGTQTVNPASTSTSVYIGADVNLQCFPGRVATAKLYNRTLSSSEVLQNYNAQKGRFGL
jgi:hypothetical protein